MFRDRPVPPVRQVRREMRALLEHLDLQEQLDQLELLVKRDR
jgi:hypothetical protein